LKINSLDLIGCGKWATTNSNPVAIFCYALSAATLCSFLF